jgi:hypothetical protein
VIAFLVEKDVKLLMHRRRHTHLLK